MADINVGTMTLAQMIARIIEKQDTFEGGAWILSMIDALTAERAHLARLHSNVTTMYLDAQAHIDAAAKRAEANAPKLIEMMEDKDKRIATLTAERDEAQRLIGIYSTSRDAVIAQLGEMNDALRAEVERLQVAQQSDAVYLADYAKKIGRLGAEVERLRPAAEAWRTLEDFREAERTGTLSDEKRTRKIHETARDAARARAAKEAKP